MNIDAIDFEHLKRQLHFHLSLGGRKHIDYKMYQTHILVLQLSLQHSLI